MSAPVRIGIDVGGTFTHAVAVDALSGRLLGKTRVPTTHTAAEGVARGIAQSLAELLAATGIARERIGFIAHSTTQATNALLEGDVATVGVVAMGRGVEGAKARADTDLGRLDLPTGTSEVHHRYVDLGRLAADDDLAAAIRAALVELISLGAGVIVAAEAFSVENPERERIAMREAAAMGVPATGTHEVSGLYGLRVRTRTSAVNASILPKMVGAATATRTAVEEEGIAAPLMIVRSDGGVMSAAEVARRPVQTLLSGPAAGVAAAVVHLGIADGVFLDVGGTSTDISAIVDGRPRERTASVGAHRLHLRTLDIETIGVAGGSMIRLAGGRVSAVGPRSAHIAGLAYVSFDEDARPESARLVAPRPGDPADYVVLASGDNAWAFTLTCARRTLDGLCPPEHADLVGSLAGMPGEEFCRRALELAGRAAGEVVDRVARDAGLAGPRRRLIGGGGGCGALLPSVGEHLGLSWQECPDADVISAVGVAKALLRESVERHVPRVDEAAIDAVRREALDAVLAMGGDTARCEAQVEVDAAAGIVRAVATAPTELDTRGRGVEVSDSEAEAVAREALGVAQGVALALEARAGDLRVFTAALKRSGLAGLLGGRSRAVVVVDGRGRARLQRGDARVVLATAESAAGALESLVEYGDHGARVPPTTVLVSGRVVDLSGVSDPAQARSVLDGELAGCDAGLAVVLVRG